MISMSLVFFFRCPAPARARDRPEVDVAPFEPDHPLRRRPGNGRVPASQKIHVGRRVDYAQSPVYLERLDGDPGLKSLRRHNLENIPGPDILFCLEHYLLILRLREIGLERFAFYFSSPDP